MSRRWSRGLTVVVLLSAVALSPSVVQARQLDRRPVPAVAHETARPSGPERTWMIEVLERLWRGLVGVWEGEGVISDPDGAPKPAADPSVPVGTI
jgi:hypothetical protein